MVVDVVPAEAGAGAAVEEDGEKPGAGARPDRAERVEKLRFGPREGSARAAVRVLMADVDAAGSREGLGVLYKAARERLFRVCCAGSSTCAGGRGASSFAVADGTVARQIERIRR